MKMDFLFGGFFWGTILILLGISVILKAVFHIEIPVFRIVFALILIVFGIKMLTGISLFDKVKRENGSVMFDSQKINGSAVKGDYNVIFGKGTIDLTGINLGTTNIKNNVHVIFGSGDIIIKKEVPVVIKATSAFGSARLPNGNSVVFGDSYYKTPAFVEGQPYILVEADVVFGNIEVIEE